MSHVTPRFEDSTSWRPTVAFARATFVAVALIGFAIMWRRPDALVIATPFAVITAWSMLTRPTAAPTFLDRLGHLTIREGDATTWSASLSGVDEMDLAVAVIGQVPWVETHPESGSITSAVADGAVQLDVQLRSNRWGRRPIEGTRVIASTAWAAFRWSATAPRHPMTTLPLPALFEVSASPRPSDGLVGLHRSARAGEGNEFAGIRPFQSGDRMRRINWPRSVRSGELQVNSTLADLDVHVALVLDTTGDFGLSEGVDGRASSLDQTVRAAGAIAAHYTTHGERVSLRMFGTSGSPTVTAGTGRSQLRRILDTLAQVQPGDARRAPTARLASRHLGVVGGQVIVMLSALIDPEALDLAMSFGRRGVPIIVIDTLPDDIAQDEDRYTSLAWRIRLLERRQELRVVATTGIPVVRWRGPGSLDQVIRDIGRRATGPRMVRR